MEFRDWFIYGMMVGLVIVCAVSFSISWSQENNVSPQISNVQGIGALSNSVQSQLNSSNANASNERTAFSQETSQNPQISTLGFVFNSILSALNIFGDMGISIFYAVSTFVVGIFSINPIVTTTIMAIVIGLILLAIWSTIRAGR